MRIYRGIMDTIDSIDTFDTVGYGMIRFVSKLNDLNSLVRKPPKKAKRIINVSPYYINQTNSPLPSSKGYFIKTGDYRKVAR